MKEETEISTGSKVFTISLLLFLVMEMSILFSNRLRVEFLEERPFVVDKIVYMRDGNVKYFNNRENIKGYGFNKPMIIAPANTWEIGDTIKLY